MGGAAVQMSSSAWFMAAGGLAGAGSIGMLEAWTNPENWGRMPPPEIELITGISVGALLTLPFAYTPRTVNDDGYDFSDALAATQCRRIMLESATHTCLLGIPNPFCCCCAPAMLTMSKIETTLRREMQPGNYNNDRVCVTTSTNMRTGRLESVTNHGGTTGDDYINAALASASIPLVFEPRLVRGDPCVDGAMRRVVPSMPADMASKVVDHIVICLCHSPEPMAVADKALRTGPGVLNAALTITNLQIIKNDLRMLLAEIDDYNRALQQLGYPKAQTHIVDPGTNFEHELQGTNVEELKFWMDRGAHRMVQHLAQPHPVSGWQRELGHEPARVPQPRVDMVGRLVL
jgi:predicted acylesterase/phospholipase RssA